VTGRLDSFAPRARVIHLDIDAAEVGKNRLPEVAVVADVRLALEAMLSASSGEAAEGRTDCWLQRIETWKHHYPLVVPDPQGEIAPQEVVVALRELAPDAFYTTDVGQHQMWAAQFLHSSPRRWVSSAGLGTMGFGLPAAMGVQTAFPNDTVICVAGDASILMNIQELATCKTENIPVKVLLLNNQHLGMVVQWEDRFFKGNRAHTYLGPVGNPEASGQGNGISPEARYPDFVGIAKGFGWQAETIVDRADLEAALKRLIDAPGPALLDVQVPYQEHVLPMIPSGGTVRDLIKR
jgi:acetolactate synthase-1/2/3 large subunit